MKHKPPDKSAPANADRDLSAIEEVAELQFSDNEIQLLCELSDTDMVSDAVVVAIARGRLRGEADVRRSIKKMAGDGSSPAQRQYLDLVRDRVASG